MKKCQACGTETNLVGALGGTMLCRDCRPEIELEIADLREAGKEVDVRLMAARRRRRLSDTTRTERVNRRNAALNEKAKSKGFDSLSQMLTAWLNDRIDLDVIDLITEGDEKDAE